MDEHIIEALGKTRIKIKNGKVVEVGEPMLSYCPIFDKFRGIKHLDKKSIQENIQFRIDDFGMCTPNRKLRMRDYLSFGVSEIISTAMELGIMDATVMVCEGCGTLVITDPEMAQGIGGRVSGLVSTTPIPELIAKIGPEYVLDPKTARMDVVAGVKKAIAMGFKNIGVSVVSAKAAKELKMLEKEHGVNVYVFVVHTTGMSEEEAREVFKYADVVTGCASKYVRQQGMESGAFKVGDSVPVFGVTDRGQRLIEEHIKYTGKKIEHKPGAKQPDRLI
ncbi:MAG TPA: methanogenesis marker 8 protein [Methanocella sp.]|uniref:methanogenesis marker 8 protein n=1 Tax=Methanocella sp. TaxID=2052833 RepID=UPI002C6B4574|nr:methanogenesis marker 8 protein [Methanocella sp.]HTY91534.1 methanogenesis marker 8 protein [Methanocella sp.]